MKNQYFTTYTPITFFLYKFFKYSGKIIIALMRKLSLIKVFVGVLKWCRFKIEENSGTKFNFCLT